MHCTSPGFSAQRALVNLGAAHYWRWKLKPEATGDLNEALLYWTEVAVRPHAQTLLRAFSLGADTFSSHGQALEPGAQDDPAATALAKGATLPGSALVGGGACAPAAPAAAPLDSGSTPSALLRASVLASR